MANVYTVIDQVLKQGSSENLFPNNGTYHVYFAEVEGEGLTSIGNYVKDTITYNDINGAPGLPADTNNSSPAWQDGIDSRVIKDFKEVAFTADYDDLSNAPTIPEIDGVRPTAFNQVAFTGNVTLDNVQVSQVLDLRSWSDINIDNISKLQSLGSEETYIRGFAGDDARLFNRLSSLYQAFNNTKRPTYIVTTAGVFQVLNIKQEMYNSNTQYFKFDVIQSFDSTYNRENYYNSGEGAKVSEAAEGLSSITFNKSSKQIWIFDVMNRVIYCKISNDLTSASLGLATVATSGSYNDLDDRPTIITSYNDLNDKPTIITNYSQLNGTPQLASVATSGNYDDLNNTHYTFSPSAFIYRYDTTNNQNINMSQEDAELLDEVGFRKGYIKNINQLYNNATTYTTDTAFTSVIEDGLLAAFLDGKICYLQTRYDYYLITKIDHFKINNALAFMSIICAPVVDNNYGEDQLFNEPTTTDTEIETILNSLTCKMKVPCVTIDFNKKILYSYYLEYIPE